MEQLNLVIPDDLPSPLYSLDDLPDVDITYPDEGYVDSVTEPVPDSSEGLSGGAERTTEGGLCLPCKVCGDKSSGFHYGVMACEGCKGFFRRSIQKKMEYKCHFAGSCPIERVNRNRCQHCRFRKCLAVGMSKESVRIGRYSKRVKQSNLDEIRKLTSRPETADEREARERREMEIYTVSQTILQAHQVTCLYSDSTIQTLIERRRELMERLRSSKDAAPCIPAAYLTDLTEEQRNDPKVVAWKSFLEAIAPCVRRIVEFAKCLPGFMKIPQCDQMQLLKQSYFEAWLIQVSPLASRSDRCLILGDSTLIHAQLIDAMDTPLLWRHILEFTTAITELNLSEMERALFVASTIINSDRAGLRHKSDLDPRAELILECLRRELCRRDARDNNTATRRLSRLVTRMQLLRSTSMLQVESLLGFRLQHPSVTLPPLLAELNDAVGEQTKPDIYDQCSNVITEANGLSKKRLRGDISEQLPLTKLNKGGGLFQPPKVVSGVPTNLTQVTPKEETAEPVSCAAANGHRDDP